MNFGEKMKMLREEKRINQNDLASLLNVSKANISRYESGIRQPSVETIILIAKLFNVSVDWLLGRSNIREFSSVNNKPRDFNTEDLEVLEIIKKNDDIYNFLKEINSASNAKIKMFFDIWKVINNEL